MFRKDALVKVDIIIYPEVLTQPNIPKPLHGLNPRTIKGDEWWDKTRREVYKSSGYFCYACGTHKNAALYHKWLEAHEMYKYDYAEGTAELEKIIPLCHACHNFIHSGRLLALYQKREIEKAFVKDVIERGFKILAEHKLKCFPGTLLTAEAVGADTYCVRPYKLPPEQAEWSDWKLIMDGKEYRGLYTDADHWALNYSKEN